MSIVFRKEKPESPIYYADADGYTFRLMHCAKGASKPAWHLFVRRTAGILGTEVELESMTEARAVAERFLVKIAGTTVTGEPGETVIGNALFGAVSFVRRPAPNPDEPVQLDDEPIEPKTDARPVVVIACGAAKIDRPAPAGELYSSQNFKFHRRAAEALAARIGGRVVILSALHGLVDPETVIAPYDVKMGDPGSIAVDVLAGQLAALAPSSIHALLPRAYGAVLDAAAEAAGAGDLVDLFVDAPGIGYQRAVSAALLRETDTAA